MANKKSINYKQLLRNMYCVEALKSINNVVTEKFKSPVKIESLKLPIISINCLRKVKNTQIWVSDEFGNSTTLTMLTDIECKLIFEQLVKDDIIRM